MIVHCIQSTTWLVVALYVHIINTYGHADIWTLETSENTR